MKLSADSPGVCRLLWLPLAGLCVICGYLTSVSLQIQQRDQSFEAIAVGDRAATVISAMGTPTRVVSGAACYLAGRREAERDPDVSQYLYTVNTFFLPITWVIELDPHHAVVAKFRLD